MLSFPVGYVPCTQDNVAFRPFVDDENKKENKTPLPAKVS